MAWTNVLIAGFGGQGLLAIGKILAWATMEEGKHVTWLPSYGPEMRGGTACCVVTIDDSPIGSPVAKYYQSAIIMNKQSFNRFEPFVAPNGLLVINSTLVDKTSNRKDIRILYVPATELAEKEGNSKAANLIMLGAYAVSSQNVNLENIEKSIKNTFEAKKNILEINLRAFRKGCEIAY